MQRIIPTTEELKEFIHRGKKAVKHVTEKMEGLREGSLKKGMYAKVQKCIFSFLMDYGGLNRYVEDDESWYGDFECKKTKKLESAREDMIDHYFRGKPKDLFISVFSIFEDSITRIIDSLNEDESSKNKLDFPEKIQKLKEMKLLTDKDDRRFCIFCMHIRNTIHSNSFYKGKDLLFKDILGEGPFLFRESYPPDFMSTDRFIKWCEELINIFEKISKSDDRIDTLEDNAMRETL